MKSYGSLATRDFPSIVHSLAEERWTGVLTLTNAGVGRSVTLQEGRMVFAASSSPDDRMGTLLLRRGRITLRQHIEASRALGPGKRLGAVLVEQGVLSPKELIAAVVEHTQEILYGCFQWTEGQYRLEAGPPSAEAITLRINTPDVIVEGIRRIESWTRISAAVGGPDAVYSRAPGYARIVAAMRLAPEKAALLRGLDAPATVAALCERGGPLADFEVCRTLWAFRVIGLVERVDAAVPVSVVEDESLGIVVPED